MEEAPPFEGVSEDNRSSMLLIPLVVVVRIPLPTDAAAAKLIPACVRLPQKADPIPSPLLVR